MDERGGTNPTGPGWSDLDRVVKWREGGGVKRTFVFCDEGGATRQMKSARNELGGANLEHEAIAECHQLTDILPNQP